MPSLVVSASVVLCLIAFTPTVNADEQKNEVKEEILQGLQPICERVSPNLVHVTEAKPMTDIRPISTEKVCTCVKQEVGADAIVDNVTRQSEANMGVTLKSKKFLSYLSMRYMAAIFECTAKEFKLPLQEVNFAE